MRLFLAYDLMLSRQVGELEGYFVFSWGSRNDRSPVEAVKQHVEELGESSSVLWMEEQEPKIRELRTYSEPADPLYSNQA